MEMKVLFIAILCITSLLVGQTIAGEDFGSSSSSEEDKDQDCTKEDTDENSSSSSSEEDKDQACTKEDTDENSSSSSSEEDASPECSDEEASEDDASPECSDEEASEDDASPECSDDEASGDDGGSDDGSGDNTSSGVVYYPKCDLRVIAKIYKFWAKYYGGYPRDTVHAQEENGKELVLKTTIEYFPITTSCLFSYVHDYYIAATSLNSNGSCTSKNVTFTENKGILITTIKDKIVTEIHRYIIFMKKGMTAFYTCAKRGVSPNAISVNSGALKASEEKLRLNPEAVLQAMAEGEEVMRYCGLDPCVSYPLQCECKPDQCDN